MNIEVLVLGVDLIEAIGIPPSKFMGGNAIFRSNHLTWDPPLGVGGPLRNLGQIAI